MSQGTDASIGESGEGTIEPEVAEKFASAFVPMWQLEEVSHAPSPVSDDESLRCTGTLPPPFDPFPRGAKVSPLAFTAFEADPFPSPRGDGISGNLGAPIGDPLTSEPVLRSPSLEPSTLESKDASTPIWEGREVLPTHSNRRLLVAVGGFAAILATLTLPFSQAKLPSQPPLQVASAEGPSLPESLSCVECRSPETCQQSPGRSTDSVCSYAPLPDGSSCASGSGSACDACAGGSCTGTLVCLGGGTCDPVAGCPQSGRFLQQR
jgi:hypothetical protein